MMREAMSVVLDAKQVREACERYVAGIVKDEGMDYRASGQMGDDPPPITVTVTKKRVRKARTKVKPASRKAGNGEGADARSPL